MSTIYSSIYNYNGSNIAFGGMVPHHIPISMSGNSEIPFLILVYHKALIVRQDIKEDCFVVSYQHLQIKAIITELFDSFLPIQMAE